jgi:anti-anti-sigma regulatory factor
MNGAGGRRIADRVRELFDNGCERVLVDLEGTRLINHNGLAELRALCDEVVRRGGWICFCNLTLTLSRAFKVAGLLDA